MFWNHSFETVGEITILALIFYIIIKVNNYIKAKKNGGPMYRIDIYKVDEDDGHSFKG